LLTLLTATGCRPEAWAICQALMSRQDYTGQVRWIVADDGQARQPVTFSRPGWKVEVIRPTPFWKSYQRHNTQARNLLAGLRGISSRERVVIIEDDDYYAPDWLSTIAAQLERAELVGMMHARYYNVRHREYRQFDNAEHASLCSTAMRGEAIDTFRKICRPGTKFIDLALWKKHPSQFLFEAKGTVGIKGLPGRTGIGIGHRDRFKGHGDPDAAMLREWLGEDARLYEGFYSPQVTRGVSPVREAYPAARREAEIEQYVKAYRSPSYKMGRGRAVFVTEIISAMPPGSLLDVGTGRGETLDIARKAGMTDVAGTEVVPYLTGGPVVQSAAHKLPFEDGSFDYVTCFDVLEHLTEEDIRPALIEMARVARKSVTVSVSEVPSFFNGRDLHISRRPKARWRALLEDCWGSVQEAGYASVSPAFQMVKHG